VAGEGRGPGAARNLGWRAATHDLIWCIDSDCVTEPDALDLLVKQMDDPRVGGAGGSYGNMVPDSLLACLIHEEIVARHARMPARVNYLATFNVIYRRAILEAIGGFDERFVTAEDCELSWRVLAAGHELAFEPRSQVRHYHPMQWQPYLRTQRKHGFYRALLYMNHREYAGGDAYSSFIDHVQPPLAMLIVASLPTLLFPSTQWITPALLAVLALAQIPMTVRLVARTKQLRYLAFAPMSMIRAFARGIGLSAGTIAGMLRRTRPKQG
jgi:cellulose synthase/poly-beta-1,6-N-acetylglucosamine synthase-like glycosyltransferase